MHLNYVRNLEVEWDGKWQMRCEERQEMYNTLTLIIGIAKAQDSGMDQVEPAMVDTGAKLIPSNTALGMDNWETTRLKTMDKDT